MQKQRPLDSALAYDPVLGEEKRDGTQGVEMLEDGRVHIRLIAPNARTVELDQFGRIYPLRKAEDGAWEGVLDMGVGFKYVFLKVDGADLLSPFLPIGFGCCRPMNYIDIPVPGMDFDALADGPHGAVERRYFSSGETGKTESCLVYTPPNYDAGKRCPVLYLQHGFGENETGWVYQGHLARIADRLICAHEAKEMLVVMGNGMTQSDHGSDRSLFGRVLLHDLIPYVESHYAVFNDKWNRAMAGLSMGSYQTSVVTLSHPELFGYAGLFSGFLRAPWGADEEKHLKLLETPEVFYREYPVFFRAMGTEDIYRQSFLDDDAYLQEMNIRTDRRDYPGGHDWTVWRRCIRDYLPLLFRQ